MRLLVNIFRLLLASLLLVAVYAITTRDDGLSSAMVGLKNQTNLTMRMFDETRWLRKKPKQQERHRLRGRFPGKETKERRGGRVYSVYPAQSHSSRSYVHLYSKPHHLTQTRSHYYPSQDVEPARDRYGYRKKWLKNSKSTKAKSTKSSKQRSGYGPYPKPYPPHPRSGYGPYPKPYPPHPRTMPPPVLLRGANVLAGEDALAEVSIDVNPTSPDNQVIVGHSNNLMTMNTFYTFDAGMTWSAKPIGNADDGLVSTFRFDPTLTFDDDGIVYVGYGAQLSDGTTTVVVCRSSDGGISYPQCTQVANAIGEDKWHLAAGPNPTDLNRQSVYIAWVRPAFGTAGGQPIFVAGSNDGGFTFLAPAPRQISDVNDRVFQTPDPAVGPCGELYVSWLDLGSADLIIDRSFDGGATFGPDIIVTTFNAVLFKTPIPAQPMRGIFNGPTLDADRSNSNFNGRLYIAYVDVTPNGLPDVDVSVISSNDHGSTWTIPVIVHDEARSSSQFLPWLDVDQQTGVVSALWYDTRDDVNDVQVNVYATVSINGGLSFGKNLRVSDNPSDMSLDPNAGRDFLEYVGVASLCGLIFPVWTDNSQGNMLDTDYYTSLLKLHNYNFESGDSYEYECPKKIYSCRKKQDPYKASYPHDPSYNGNGYDLGYRP